MLSIRRPEMNRQDARGSLVDVGDEFDFEMDLQVAARSKVPVLISGSPRCALMLAQAIAGRVSRAELSLRVVPCDAADADELRVALADADTGDASASDASILF